MFRTSRWSSAFVPTQRRRTSFRSRRSVVALLVASYAPVRSHLATSGPPSRASVGSRVASDSRVGWLTSGDQGLHRATDRRRQEPPRRHPAAQALPRPPPLPSTSTTGAADDLTGHRSFIPTHWRTTRASRQVLIVA